MDSGRKPKFYLAPMVRYSKLAFRQLVRLYGVDCCYTPMIYAKNFLESEYCRSSEFSTTEEDRPLIVQFASDDPSTFATAAELIYRYASGVDLNCGCPKSDVRAKGFGSFLLSRPDVLADIVRQCRARICDPEFTISLKIRVQYPLKQTVELCQKAERAGVSHLTVHGRTPQMRSEPVDYDAIRVVKDSVNVPIIANGNITKLDQALEIAESTAVDGVMAANGLLYNPAMFAGHDYTPASCVRDFPAKGTAASNASCLHPYSHLVNQQIAMERDELLEHDVVIATSVVLPVNLALIMAGPLNRNRFHIVCTPLNI